MGRQYSTREGTMFNETLTSDGDEDQVVLTTDFSFLTKFTKIGYSMNK